ncbi:major capsid protein, partial [uncultured marine virus]
EATAATINQIRQAFQIQRLYERDARGGTRYTEIVRSHFGVTSPDARLQRPEYLGGGSTPINISPVPQTFGNDCGQPPGQPSCPGNSHGPE